MNEQDTEIEVTAESDPTPTPAEGLGFDCMPVEYPVSTNIHTLRYFPNACILHITFVKMDGENRLRGNTYNYSGIQAKDFIDLRDGKPSVGKYFAANFRPKFKGAPIAAEDLMALQDELLDKEGVAA